jgi:hypothetical protein
METLFRNSGVGTINGGARPDENEYEYHVRTLIEDAVDFEESYLSAVREENQSYYNGIAPYLSAPGEGEEREAPNRSTFVSTDVRDTVLAIMPSLMRIFTNVDQKVAEFVPSGEEHQEMADQAYDYVNYVFYKDNPGFLTLHNVLKDSLTVKAGITKWWTDNDTEVKEYTFTNLSVEQYQYLIHEAPEAEIVEMGQWGEDQRLDEVTFRVVVDKPKVKCEAVPPEEFRISRHAKNVETSPLVGHERVVSLSELVSKGYDPDFLGQYVGTAIDYSDDKFLRNPALTDGSGRDGILYGEYYVRVDKDGDGIEELRLICTVGDSRVIIEDDIVPYTRFAVWGVDPVPHTVIGDCIADITKDIQRIKTNMMRGQLDGLAESMNPRTVVNELVTNIEDVLNDDVGAVIRTRGDPTSSVAFSKTPYTGAEVQVTIDYLDKVRASRTGITEASKGLDPKAMQSTALVGIDAIVSGAQERIELIARVLAETGLRPTLEGILREITDNPNPSRTLKLRGKWVNVNPSFYDPNMRIEVNPTLGKGTDTVRLQALNKIEQTQLMIISKFGINNPIVTPKHFLNTQKDIMSIANIRNYSRYFGEVTDGVMEAIASQPKDPDPTSVLAQAELEKVKKDVIVETGKLALEQKKLASRIEKDLADDDYRRDKLNLDTSVKVMDIASKEDNDKEFEVKESIKRENVGNE